MPERAFLTLSDRPTEARHRLVEPFATRMPLTEDAAGWRIAEIESSEGHLNWTLGRAGGVA